MAPYEALMGVIPLAGLMWAAGVAAQRQEKEAPDFLFSFPCFSKQEQRTVVKACGFGRAGSTPTWPHQASRR